MELSSRQLDIVGLVRKHEPVTGEQIAEMLGVSRPTIRSDLAVLVMLDMLNAKPKVGYFLGPGAGSAGEPIKRLRELKVRDIQGIPIMVREMTTVHDAVVTLFVENVGSLIVADESGCLSGVVSRKDLLKFSLGNPSAGSMPVSLVMTRQPNIVTASPDDSVVDAAAKLIKHQVDGLPVVREENGKQEVVGRVTKTTMTRILLEIAHNP